VPLKITGKERRYAVESSQLKLDLGFNEALNYLSPDRFGFCSILYDTGMRGVDEKGRPYPIKRQRSYKLSDLETTLKGWSGTTDTWLTQNSFHKPNRKTANLKALHNSYVDLDYYKVDQYKRSSPDAMLTRALRIIEDAKIPLPNVIVDSGRGLQLKWCYPKPIREEALPRWRRVQLQLISLLAPLGADTTCKDPSRVLRLVGTLNSKSRSMTTVLLETKTKVPFDTLADAILPFTRAELAQLRQQRAGQLELIHSESSNSNLKKKTKGTLNWSRYLDLRDLCRMRQGIAKGRRMKMLMYMTNFYCLSGNHPDQVRGEINGIINWIDPHWLPDQGQLATVYEKAEAHFRGETVLWNDEQRTPLYTPTNDTLINEFGITPDEERQLRTIISKTEVRRRNTEAKREARRADGVIPREQYEQQSASNQKPWEKLGMSRRTWYRKGKPMPENDVAQVCPVI